MGVPPRLYFIITPPNEIFSTLNDSPVLWEFSYKALADVRHSKPHIPCITWPFLAMCFFQPIVYLTLTPVKAWGEEGGLVNELKKIAPEAHGCHR